MTLHRVRPSTRGTYQVVTDGAIADLLGGWELAHQNRVTGDDARGRSPGAIFRPGPWHTRRREGDWQWCANRWYNAHRWRPARRCGASALPCDKGPDLDYLSSAKGSEENDGAILHALGRQSCGHADGS